MHCPHCQHNNSRVIDSRPTEDGRCIRRRRECENCGFRFTTFERYEETTLLVIKKDGNREAFNRQKLLNGIIRSAEKRPISMEKINQVVEEIDNQVRGLGESEVTSQVIGEFVMNALKDLDEIAYIRFASVYRQFKDMDDFMNELQDVMHRDRSHKRK